jgi:serine/threonine-protein kinase
MTEHTPGKSMNRTCMRFMLICVALFCWCASPLLAAHGVQGKIKKNAFGAIAHHRDSKSFGYSYDFASRREARFAALAKCEHPKCEIAVSFNSACAALAHGPKISVTASGATGQEAQTKALRKCASAKCEVLAWACTR